MTKCKISNGYPIAAIYIKIAIRKILARYIIVTDSNKVVVLRHIKSFFVEFSLEGGITRIHPIKS